MSVSYLQPLGRAWERTRRSLFQPFDVERWLVLGFAAFLAGLVDSFDGPGFSFGWNRPLPPFGGWWRSDWARRHAWDRGGLEGVALVLLPFLLVLAIALFVLLLWLSSRGKLLFLEAAWTGRAAIVEPWRRFGAAGDSLFLWRLGFAALTLLVVLALFAPLLTATAFGFDGAPQRWLMLLVTVGLACAVGFAVAVVWVCLEHFVVPIMYRDGLRTSEAWRRLLPLLRAYPVEFVLYGLFVLLLWIAVAFAIVAVSVATCCIGGLVLSLPYVRSVLLLPALLTLRLLGPEFLGQFGPEFALPEAAPPAPAQTGPDGPPPGGP